MVAAQQTRANIDFIKRQLRSSFPHIKSSHLSEGIAAAFGHRTNASLIAHLIEPGALSIATLDERRWDRRLTDLGYSDVPWQPIVTTLGSPVLPDPTWGIGAPRNRAAQAAWFARCRKSELPFVYITARRLYSDIDWDCITVASSTDRVIRKDEGRTILNSMFQTFQRVAASKSGRPIFEGSAFVGSIKQIALPAAHILAAHYFSFLFDLSHGTEKKELTARG